MGVDIKIENVRYPEVLRYISVLFVSTDGTWYNSTLKTVDEVTALFPDTIHFIALID